MHQPTPTPGHDAMRHETTAYAPLFYAPDEDDTAPEAVALTGRCRWWCDLTDPVRVHAADHGDRCAAGMSVQPAHDDDGHAWDVAAELVAPYFHGAYPPPAAEAARLDADRVALTFEQREGIGWTQTVHVSPAGARQLAARLLHLADISDRTGAGALLWEAKTR